MSKLSFSVIFILLFTLLMLKNIEVMYWSNYPKIMLPEKAHNTIGEIPLVEHIDDNQVVINNVKSVTYPSNRMGSSLSCDFAYN